MGWFRKDKRIDHAFINLMDAICEWERSTGRGSRLLFVPDEKDEEIILLIDGKPIFPIRYNTLMSVLGVMKHTIERRFKR